MTELNRTPSQRRALLVEDNRPNRTQLAHLLKQQGFEVTMAKDGREAVTRFVDGDFDLVLMDVQMPVMDGIAATQIIRQHEFASGGHTPIVAVTGNHDRETCLEAGMDEHLIKPVTPSGLQAALQRLGPANVS